MKMSADDTQKLINDGLWWMPKLYRIASVYIHLFEMHIFLYVVYPYPKYTFKKIMCESNKNSKCTVLSLAPHPPKQFKYTLYIHKYISSMTFLEW